MAQDPEAGFDWRADRPILQPGRNCWRIERAGRAAVLVDGAAYFSRLESALRSARRSVLILGWDFDGRIRLRPDVDPDESPPLGPFLRSLVEARPDLEIRILVWSVAVVHAPGAPAPLLFGAEWQNHPRLVLKLDTQHPIYAAHHQKIVCIDDRLAFVGGMDLTVRRWDTRDHVIDDPSRVDPDGNPYPPVHDVQMVVDGEAAEAVASLARRRWQVATGERLPDVTEVGSDPWPADVVPDFTETPVAIARTMPPWGGEPGICEVAAMTADALAAAKRAIYIEAQYMTAWFVGDILERQLQNPEGPEVVVLMTYESRGLMERFVMGSNRDRLIRRLRLADRHGRLRVWYPCRPDRGGSRQQIRIHAKLMIVDDVFIRVGSSNLNNRSVGLDTECDLAVEARDEATRQVIGRLRDEFVAEHLDVEPGEVANAVRRHHGSLIGAVERLNHGPRGLTPFGAMSDAGPTRPLVWTGLLDPKCPYEPLWFLRRRRLRA
jgi:phosphatidylserine/phosphatidylglycerophosphate/cardiolipin synthase-like enzyme